MMHVAEVLNALAEAGIAAAEAMERGDEAALTSALDERDRLQAVADPLLAALQAPGTPRAVIAEARELAMVIHLCDGVLLRGLTARRDEARGELRRLDVRTGALNAYAAPSPGGARLRAVG
ncbi:hypothetical protein [Longimicrobium sp.]|uniref:hypothetical protein n=1 Tax=Longimicrobium sp. TaxID=2029185 RepID=UPI002E2F1DB8|nr:hypothetical protein [Longimicrobium sp.]HEX6037814.1 hypothetical protein [Longimicrobium sp.]